MMSTPTEDENTIDFSLFDLVNKDLKKFFLEEKVKNEKVVVISLFGKTSLNSSQFKEHLIAEVLNKHIFERSCEVEGYCDPSVSAIFLQATDISDTSVLVRKCKELGTELETKSFLEVWSDLHLDFAKILLTLFCVSHIIIITHPKAGFDVSYI
nr:protein smg8 isoform X2 [Parasteatoda tepidariorum]